MHNALGQRVFKTEPLYPPAEGDESDQGFMASLLAFFTSLWNPAVAPAENLGFIFIYDEDGTLLGETGTGGANSGGEAFYLWLPTANGTLPVMMISGVSRYAIHADHLNTPRRLTEWNGNLAWQWAYSAFGDAQPTVADRRFASVAPALGDFEFNLRYPGQTADKESGLFYDYFRSYNPTTGRYTEADPIGLGGGWNRFSYVSGNALGHSDPQGLQAQALGCAFGMPFGPVGCGAGAAAATIGSIIGMGVLATLPSESARPGRPKDMSPAEERQFDRHCTGNHDPCSELKRATRTAIAGAQQKMNNMLSDSQGMFGGLGWNTHRADLSGRISSIMAMISLGKKMGCNMTEEEAAASLLFLPLMPR